MRQDPIKTEQVGGLTVKVFYDDNGMNPRTDWDNITEMHFFGSYSHLGDSSNKKLDNYKTPNDLFFDLANLDPYEVEQWDNDDWDFDRKLAEAMFDLNKAPTAEDEKALRIEHAKIVKALSARHGMSIEWVKKHTDRLCEVSHKLGLSLSDWQRKRHEATVRQSKRRKRSAKKLHDKLDKIKDFVFPIYLYDHSGVTISMSKFSCPWDSGQAGYIVMRREELLKNWPALKGKAEKVLAEKAREVCESDIQVYDNYLQGNVYGFVVEDADGNHLDSCWGFLSLDEKGNDNGDDECLAEGVGHAKWLWEKMETERIAKEKAEQDRLEAAQYAFGKWFQESLEQQKG